MTRTTPNLQNNLLYSVVLTLSTYLVPLFVFPYISRVLGVDVVGDIDTVDSLMDGLILFSMMGMSTVAVREIARSKDDKAKLSQTFTDLFALNLLSTLAIATVFGISLLFMPHIQNFGYLLAIGILKLFANLFWIEWFYTGIEAFRFITIRSLIVRTCFILSVFLFVSQQADGMIYYALFVGMTIANAVCNWGYKREFISIRGCKPSLKHYLKPFIVLGLFAMLSAIYTKFSMPVLNYLCGSVESGYYTTSARFYQVIIALVSTLTGVMIPRMSILVKNAEWDKVRSYVDFAFRLLFLFSVPIIVLFEIFGADIIRVFAGDAFTPAISSMHVIMLMLLVVGAEKIIVLQLLVPLCQDKNLFIAGVCGVLVWGISTIALVPTLQSVGSAMSWMLAEATVLTIGTICTYRIIHIGIPVRWVLRSALYAIPYVCVGLLLFNTIHDEWSRFILCLVIFLIYTLMLDKYAYKTEIASSLIRKFSKKK